MRILNFVALVAIIFSINILDGIIIIPTLALEQPNQTRAVIEPGLASNITSSLGSNLSNATAPAE